MNDKYFIYAPNIIVKEMADIPLPWQERIKKAIDFLQLDPYYGEKMQGIFFDLRKIRVWPYRIMYKIDEKKNAILIFAVFCG